VNLLRTPPPPHIHTNTYTAAAKFICIKLMGNWKGWATSIEIFLSPEMATSKACAIWAQKVKSRRHYTLLQHSIRYFKLQMGDREEKINTSCLKPRTSGSTIPSAAAAHQRHDVQARQLQPHPSANTSSS
jgi:hypothetical protein